MKSMHIFLLLISVAFSACASRPTTKKKPMATVVAPKPKPIQKTAQPTLPKKEKKISKKELIRYVLRLSDLSKPLTEEDEKVLLQLDPKPRVGSIQEAAIVIGTSRDILSKKDVKKEFKEEDINNSTPKTHTQPSVSDNKSLPHSKQAEATDLEENRLQSLEAKTLDKDIILAEALEKNFVLKTHKIYHIVLKALESSHNSKDFENEVKEVIYREASLWASILRNSPDFDGNLKLKGTEDKLSEKKEPIQTEARNKKVYSISNLKKGDALLMKAVNLAEKGRFKQAILYAVKIKPQDPFYTTAREKVRVFSNRAVQVLRQKAAQAFQSAIPEENVEAKTAYLEQAKEYLNEALTDYPDADNLRTVQDNLAVITRDLESLSQIQSEEEESSTKTQIIK